MIIVNDCEKLDFPYAEKIGGFLKKCEAETLEKGRYDLGDDCYVSVSEYATSSEKELLFEGHERYLDVQYLAYGEEAVYLAEKKRALCTREYDKENDYSLYVAQGEKKCALTAGVFMVLYPDDLHAPGRILREKPCFVKKLVFKILKK